MRLGRKTKLPIDFGHHSAHIPPELTKMFVHQRQCRDHLQLAENISLVANN